MECREPTWLVLISIVNGAIICSKYTLSYSVTNTIDYQNKTIHLEFNKNQKDKVYDRSTRSWEKVILKLFLD